MVFSLDGLRRSAQEVTIHACTFFDWKLVPELIPGVIGPDVDRYRLSVPPKSGWFHLFFSFCRHSFGRSIADRLFPRLDGRSFRAKA
jgi:hypothetical protein